MTDQDTATDALELVVGETADDDADDGADGQPDGEAVVDGGGDEVTINVAELHQIAVRASQHVDLLDSIDPAHLDADPYGLERARRTHQRLLRDARGAVGGALIAELDRRRIPLPQPNTRQPTAVELRHAARELAIWAGMLMDNARAAQRRAAQPSVPAQTTPAPPPREGHSPYL